MFSDHINLYFSGFKFRIFEQTVRSSTWSNHDQVINWALKTYDKSYTSSSEIVSKGKYLRDKILDSYKNYYIEKRLTIFIHIPEKIKSPAGFSIFNGYLLAFKYLGINALGFTSIEEFNLLINKFTPDIVLASDNNSSFFSINWELLNQSKTSSRIIVGLTASTEAEKKDKELILRLNRARKYKVDFFYSFKSKQHINNNIAFNNYFSFGFNLFDIEFGCNPIFHFPIESDIKDLDYIFLASSNIDKREKYYKWLPKITKNFHGFIDGPGWHKINSCADFNLHSLLYSRSKIGLNLHIQDSISQESELNERTFILAACGIPQLIDNPKLLHKRFSQNSLFSASTPKEYFELFKFMLQNPLECEKRSLLALKEVYENHTIFSRLSDFLNQLNINFNIYEK